ncbi:tyrosine-type recombinase/integrase [Aliarcobacter butzleri]
MAKKNQYELIDDSIIVNGVSKLEPYDDWKENIAFWIAQYLNQKCDEQSRRFVTEGNMPKITNIQEAILESKDIEEIGRYVNKLGILKFKAIKQYYNNIYPFYYYMLERKAYSIKNITTTLLINYFSNTEEKQKKDLAADKIRKISVPKNIKNIWELSYTSKINRLTVLLNFIKFIENSNIDKESENEVFLFNIERSKISKSIQKEKRVLSVLTPKDGFQKFFNAIETVPYKDEVRERNILMLKLLMYLGIRVSELIYLKKDDITIDKNIVKFNIIGKGNKQRLLYVTYSHIKKHMIKYEKIRTESSDGFYFTTSRGKQVNDRYINTLVHDTLITAGIEVTKKSSVHMLRHSVASYLKHTLKMDNASISKWLGHDDIRTTMIYLHYTEQEIIDMAKSFKKIG